MAFQVADEEEKKERKRIIKTTSLKPCCAGKETAENRVNRPMFKCVSKKGEEDNNILKK